MRVLLVALLAMCFGFTGSDLETSKSFQLIGGNDKVVKVAVGEKVDICQIEIENTTDQPISLKWKRISNTFLSSWDYSMCAYGECQIGIPKGAKLKTIEPGKKGFIAIHVFPKGNTGTGEVKFEVIDSNSGQKELITFTVEVGD